MDLPIEIERATWSGRGQLDWWVKERQEWWGRVRGAVGFPHGSRSRRRPGARRGRVHHRVSVGGCEVWTYDLGMTATPDDGEDVLAGGDMTAVVRIGDTVRRTAGPWTPTVHAFMRHLRASGFSLIPSRSASTSVAARSSRCCRGTGELPTAGLRLVGRDADRRRPSAAQVPRRERRLHGSCGWPLAVASPHADAGHLPQRLRALQPDVSGRRATGVIDPFSISPRQARASGTWPIPPTASSP